jgi:hypothetical protein
VFQRELKKAMNALNSHKTNSSSFAPASAPAPAATSSTPLVASTVTPAFTQPEAIVKAAVASNSVMPLIKKDLSVRSVDPQSPSPPTLGVPRQLKIAPTKPVSSSHTVTTSMQFSGYEARCETILKTLVCTALCTCTVLLLHTVRRTSLLFSRHTEKDVKKEPTNA